MRYLLYICLACLMCLTAVFSYSSVDPLREQSLLRLVARADSGIPQAQYALGSLYEQGVEGFPMNPDSAVKLYKSAASQGYAPACNQLGYIYFTGFGSLKSNADSAFYWIEKAALAGDAKAANNLGWMLSNRGSGLKTDTVKAIYWYERAAEDSLPTAMSSLAELLLQEDPVRAFSLLDASARRGFIPAADMLMDYKKDEWLTLENDSLLSIAESYFHDKVFAISAPLLQELADRGDVFAISMLAQSYARGYGLVYDYEKAMNLFALAASLGDPSAQFILAETLEFFPDMIFDMMLAPEMYDPGVLFQMASEKGIFTSEDALGRISP